MKNISIGIPVCNEIKFLPKLIDNLEKIKIEFESRVEIILIDNFSTDGSREFLNDLRNHVKYLDFRIVLNTENEGFNFSCDTLMAISKNDYLWIIGAQDIIYVSEVYTLFNLIDAEDPILVICNARMRDEISNEITNESLWGKTISSTFSSLEVFFESLGGPCQAVSCNIFKTNSMRNVLEGRGLISHYWGYFERICDLLIIKEKHEKIIFISEPLIEILIEVDVVSVSGISLFGKVPRRDYGPFYALLELAEIANYKFPANKGIRNSFTPFRDPFAIPRCFVVAKTRGLTLDWKLFLRLVKAYRGSKLFWIFGIPILISPKFISILAIKSKPIIHFLRKILRIREF